MAEASFNRLYEGADISAFNDRKLVMSMGEPVVARHFTVKELQEYICTLEQAIEDEPKFGQRLGLQRIHCALTISLDALKQNHEEFCKAAPSGADFEEYLSFYNNAVKGGLL